MDLKPLPYCYFNSQITELESAKISIMTHALQYATACFEGVRGYYQDGKIHLVKLREHQERLKNSEKILKMETPESVDQQMEIIVDLVKRNQPKSGIYVRPFTYMSDEQIVPRLYDLTPKFACYMFEMGDYLDMSRGMTLMVSSWRKVSDDAMPTHTKASAIYLNAALAKTEAHENGCDDAIVLNSNGKVAEGSANNIFLVSGEKLITPDLSQNGLQGITRLCAIEIARDLGIEIIERGVDRSELYIADGVFLTGTAAQVAWVEKIDGRLIGSGQIHPLAAKIKDIYFAAVTGQEKKYQNWLTIVDV